MLYQEEEVLPAWIAMVGSKKKKYASRTLETDANELGVSLKAMRRCAREAERHHLGTYKGGYGGGKATFTFFDVHYVADRCA